MISAKGRLVSVPVRTEFRGVAFNVNAKLTGRIDRSYPHGHEVERSDRYPAPDPANGDALSDVVDGLRFADEANS